MCFFYAKVEEHTEVIWKERNLIYVPWWTSVPFDVQAITDLPYRYLSETECFQFLKCKPSFFFFFFPGKVDGLLQSVGVKPSARFTFIQCCFPEKYLV